MKRVLLISALLVIAISLSFSQIAYKQGDMVVSGMLGLGGVAGSFGSTTMPPLSASVDYGFNENISVGGLVGYSGSEYDFFFTKVKYTYLIIGARGAYHYDLLHQDNIDTYGGIMLGYNVVGSDLAGDLNTSYLIYGGYVGGRYYFTPNLAAQLELGYGMGFITVGVAYKL